MTSNNIRLSRISHPRATLWAMVLLIVVFLGFGVWAEATLPTANTSAILLDSHLANSGWLTQFTAVLR